MKSYELEEMLKLNGLSVFTAKDVLFKGGTALQKLYGLNRLSRGLDFNLIEGDEENKLARAVKRISDYYACSIAARQKD
jgi:predicted nucleotidyltransferase component of viral defense system